MKALVLFAIFSWVSIRSAHAEMTTLSLDGFLLTTASICEDDLNLVLDRKFFVKLEDKHFIVTPLDEINESEQSEILKSDTPLYVVKLDPAYPDWLLKEGCEGWLEHFSDTSFSLDPIVSFGQADLDHPNYRGPHRDDSTRHQWFPKDPTQEKSRNAHERKRKMERGDDDWGHSAPTPEKNNHSASRRKNRQEDEVWP